MKLLIITHSYTPDLTPRAFRWSAVAAQLVARGHEVHVLCASAPGKIEADDGVTVHRVRDWLLNASGRVAAGAKIPSTARARRGVGTILRGALHKVVRALWRGLYWPDYACGWVIPGARAARSLCAKNRYDWIVSVSHPFTGHLIALLARPAAPSVCWFVDIGDPFSLMKEPSPNNHRLYRWINQGVEARVLAAADVISVTTLATQRLYESNFAMPSGKVRVVPPLLSLPKGRPSSWTADDVTLKFVFVGTLYRRLRSPRFLLACYAALQSALPERCMELHFYGAMNDCADELGAISGETAKTIFSHGLVSRTEVLQAMTDASVLVNIGNDSEAQLASKVIEYMAVGKPIINLTSLSADASLIALADYPAVLNLRSQMDTPSAACIENLRNFVLALPVVPADAVEAVRLRYSAEHVAGIYENLLTDHAIST